MSIFAIIFLVFGVSLMAISFASSLREAALTNSYERIKNAIYLYNQWLIAEDYRRYRTERIPFEILDGCCNQRRIWDWSYEKYIEPETLAMLKPYMNLKGADK